MVQISQATAAGADAQYFVVQFVHGTTWVAVFDSSNGQGIAYRSSEQAAAGFSVTAESLTSQVVERLNGHEVHDAIELASSQERTLHEPVAGDQGDEAAAG